MEILITDAIETYNFLQTIKDEKLPIKVAYKIGKLLRALDEEVAFYKQKFQSILEQYAIIKDNKFAMSEDGQSILIQPDKQQECANELNDLRRLSICIPDITFELDDFCSLEITASQFSILAPFIVD